MMNDPMLAGPKIAYVLGGNRYAPRAAKVRLYTADGQKDLKIPLEGPLKRTIETVLECAPARIEAYDKEGGLLRSLDLTKLEDTGEEGTSVASETTTHVTREERLLAHFAKLLSEAKASSDAMMARAFKSVAQIAEHHAARAAMLEQRNATLQNALVKQAGNLVQAQLATAMAQQAAKGSSEDGDEGDNAVLQYLQKLMSKDDKDDKPQTNGAAS